MKVKRNKRAKNDPNSRRLTRSKLLEIWSSNGKRFKVAKFKCSYCGRIITDSTFSFVDGVRSCEKCDEYDF